MAEVVVRAAVFGPRDDRGSAAALCAASGWRRDGRQYFHRSHLNPRQQLRLKKRGSVCSDLFARICLFGSVSSPRERGADAPRCAGEGQETLIQSVQFPLAHCKDLHYRYQCGIKGAAPSCTVTEGRDVNGPICTAPIILAEMESRRRGRSPFARENTSTHDDELLYKAVEHELIISHPHPHRTADYRSLPTLYRRAYSLQ